MTTAVGVAWAAFALVVAARRRPAPARLRALATSDGVAPRAEAPPRSGVRLATGRLVARLVAGRGDTPDDARARQIGGAVLAAVATIPLAPWPPVVPAAAAAWVWWWPARTRRRRERRRHDEIAATVPDVVDLFVLAVDAGLTVPLALRAVGAHAGGPLGDELRCTTRQIDELGRRTADALDDLVLPHRAGEAVRPLTAALTAGERYGAPLATTLGRLADDSRRARRRRAEEAARRLPVTMLFPLVTCTLPAFGLLTVGPLVAGAFRSLRL